MSSIDKFVRTPYLLATIQLDQINRTVVAQAKPTNLSFKILVLILFTFENQNYDNSYILLKFINRVYLIGNINCSNLILLITN
jgi:hypothetical protein